MSLKSEAKHDARNKFADLVGELDSSTPTYGVFMLAIGIELVVAYDAKNGDEYDQKYYRCFSVEVADFCDDRGWPAPEDLLAGDISVRDEFYTTELAKITDLPVPYGPAAAQLLEEFRSDKKQSKALRKILEAAGENPSFEKLASKLYKAMDSGNYGGIELNGTFQQEAEDYLRACGWPTREEHQKMGSEAKAEIGLYDDFFFHPLRSTGAFLIDRKFVEPEDAFKQGLRDSTDPSYEDEADSDIFKTAEELGLDLGAIA